MTTGDLCGMEGEMANLTSSTTDFLFNSDTSTTSSMLGGGGADSPGPSDNTGNLPSYIEAFPPLPNGPSCQQPLTGNGYVNGISRYPDEDNNSPAIALSNLVQIFTIPYEERRFKKTVVEFGAGTSQAKVCAQVAKSTQTKIEVTENMDHSLNIMVSGKQENVKKARRDLLSNLQTQILFQISVPKEHHGKLRRIVKELELSTMTMIKLPPQSKDDSNVSITGTKEGIEKARHEIEVFAAEQAKFGFEKIDIPKIYHRFICGPNNDNVNQLSDRFNCKINVPPPGVDKDEIFINGDKNGVLEAKRYILNFYENKKKKCSTIPVEVDKSQHKYIIGVRGTGITEILEKTGISVEVPPSDSDSKTITLRGEPEMLGKALTLVYEKVASHQSVKVHAPAWTHRYLIGRSGANIKQITASYPNVNISMISGEDQICLDGPLSEIEPLEVDLINEVNHLQSTYDVVSLPIDTRHHSHLIGKNGANLKRLKDAYKVQVSIPNEGDTNGIVKIEGEKCGVKRAKEELLQIVAKLENEKKSNMIIEQRFHRQIIGQGGSGIRKLKERYPDCVITFPNPGQKSNLVNLRGPREQFDRFSAEIDGMHRELIENNYQILVPIFKKFHKNIIGKGGARISQLRRETNTNIELPSENAMSDSITITGRKDDVERAKEEIIRIQKEQSNIVEVNVNIPSKQHNAIIGRGGNIIKSIMAECGGVSIHMHASGDCATIRGPQEDVERARQRILEESKRAGEKLHELEIHVKPELHKLLIGRDGVIIKKLREQTGCRINFPAESASGNDVVTIIGAKDSIGKAKDYILKRVEELENTTETIIDIDSKYHRHFLGRGRQVLNQLQYNYEGVVISFPRSNQTSTTVVIKGPHVSVEGAVNEINQIVSDLQNQVSIAVDIDQKQHRTVMGAKGSHVQSIESEYGVKIKFPEREISPRHSNYFDSSFNPNQVIITGHPEKCEAAKIALLEMVPEQREIEVDPEYHRGIIGYGGQDLWSMQEKFNVRISIPKPNDNSRIITIDGCPRNVERAIAALHEKVESLESQRIEREKRSFKLMMHIPSKFHRDIIRKNGANIKKLSQNFQVNISLGKNPNDPDEVVITGYEENANDARDELDKFVSELYKRIEYEVRIDNRVHARLIGTKGKTIQKFSEQYNVDVRFPGPQAVNPDSVVIVGLPECVEDARFALLNIEEEYLQDVSASELMDQYTHPPSREAMNGTGRNDQNYGFQVRDAPWDLANMGDGDFPSLQGSATSQQAPVWPHN